MRKIQVVSRGKQVGEIVDDCYITHRDVNRHFYFKGRGYPISHTALMLCKEKGVTKIQVIEHGAGGITIYEATLEKYLNAVLIREAEFDAQRCVPLVEMTKL